jgi:hypothetical protein
LCAVSEEANGKGTPKVKNVLIFARGRHLVDASTAIIAENGFHAVGVTRDDEALAQLDTGRFAAVLVGRGVERASRPPIRQHAASHGTLVIEAQPGPRQSIQDYVRDVIVPQLLSLD